MKRLYVIIAAMMIVAGMMAATASDSLQQANDLYSKKKYDSALDIYSRLAKGGYQSSVLYYNTGNAYYKLGDFVRATLFYERALLLDPGNEDIKYNLEVARTNQVDKLDVIPEFFVWTWMRAVASILSSNTWVAISVVFFLGALTLIYFFLFSTSVTNKRTLFGLAILLAIVSVKFLVLAHVENKIHTVREAAIVITPSVNAKSSPDDSGTDLFVIHEGLKVQMVDKVSGWVKIKLSNGSVGWLKTSDVEVI